MKKIMVFAMAGLVGSLAPAAADEVRLVTGNDYMPFTDESLPEGGLVTDILHTAYADAGYDVTIDFMPWRRGLNMVESGDYVATFPYVSTDERRETYAFSDPVFIAEERPFVTAENAGTVLSYDDMKGKTACLPVGWEASSSEINDLIVSGEVNRASPDSMENCFDMLSAGRVDFIPAEEPAGMTTAAATLGSVDEIHAEDFVTAETRLYLIFTQDNEAAVEQANSALQALHESGKFDEIVAKHIGG